MPTIQIQGTVIEFPNSAASPNWAPALVQFAEAVELALSGVVGEFDVSPQAFDLSAFNPGTDIDIPNLNFPTSQVRSSFISYAIFRSTDDVSVAETGDVAVLYNPANPTGNKWEISPIVLGDASITLSMTDVGQVQISLASISGANYSGIMTYSAKSLKQS